MTKHTGEEIVEAFTCGDCWDFAYTMREKFPYLQIAAFFEEDGGWTHCVVYDSIRKEIIDIEGTTPIDNVSETYENGFIWDYWDIVVEPDDFINGLKKIYEISADEGIELFLKKNKWIPAM